MKEPERETERPSKIFGEIMNLQTSMDTTYREYNIMTGRCKNCEYFPSESCDREGISECFKKRSVS